MLKEVKFFSMLAPKSPIIPAVIQTVATLFLASATLGGFSRSGENGCDFRKALEVLATGPANGCRVLDIPGNRAQGRGAWGFVDLGDRGSVKASLQVEIKISLKKFLQKFSGNPFRWSRTMACDVVSDNVLKLTTHKNNKTGKFISGAGEWWSAFASASHLAHLSPVIRFSRILHHQPMFPAGNTS